MSRSLHIPPDDFSSWSRARRDEWFATSNREIVAHERESEKATYRESVSAPRQNGAHWNAPKPLPSRLLPVPTFDLDFLPGSIAPWVGDIADRMQCPLEFVAVPAVVALGAALGRKIAIRPQRRTDWLETPNLWGCVVGRPGAMKSPAATEALKPLVRLETAAREQYEAARKAFAKEDALAKIRKDEAGKAARAAIKSGGDALAAFDIDEPEEPKAKRFLVNDTSYEALGEILADNPNGVLAHRDELVSLLKTLDREEYAAARGFFLSAWNGTGGYTFDRIVRGRKHIDAACLSLIGGTQPGRIAEYMRRAVSGGAGDDGLIQRFGLLVWPDQSPEWKEVDRFPDSEARRTAWATFEAFEGSSPEAFGAERDEYDALPFLRTRRRRAGCFCRVARRSGKAIAQRRSIASAGEPLVEVSQARARARSHQPSGRPGHWGRIRSCDAESAGARRVFGKPRAASLCGGERSGERGGEGYPRAHPSNGNRGRLHAPGHPSEGMGEPQRPRPSKGRPRSADGPRLAGGEDGTDWRPSACLLRDQSGGAGMSYLDRLRALDAKKHIPEQPSKGSKAPFEPFEGEQSERVSPKFYAGAATAPPAYDAVALQRLADQRNASAFARHSTERFCACGSLAESGYPDGRGGTVWRCWRCFPVSGRA